MGINKDNVLYAGKVYTLGDSYYWRVMVRFKGDKKDTCILRTLDEDHADKLIDSLTAW